MPNNAKPGHSQEITYLLITITKPSSFIKRIRQLLLNSRFSMDASVTVSVIGA
jgi:hypothetical protein